MRMPSRAPERLLIISDLGKVRHRLCHEIPKTVRHPLVSRVRTPDVVEFAVNPKMLSPSKGMAQSIFPAGLKLRGDIRSSETGGYGWNAARGKFPV